MALVVIGLLGWVRFESIVGWSWLDGGWWRCVLRLSVTGGSRVGSRRDRRVGSGRGTQGRRALTDGGGACAMADGCLRGIKVHLQGWRPCMDRCRRGELCGCDCCSWQGALPSWASQTPDPPLWTVVAPAELAAEHHGKGMEDSRSCERRIVWGCLAQGWPSRDAHCARILRAAARRSHNARGLPLTRSGC